MDLTYIFKPAAALVGKLALGIWLGKITDRILLLLTNRSIWVFIITNALFGQTRKVTACKGGKII